LDTNGKAPLQGEATWAVNDWGQGFCTPFLLLKPPRIPFSIFGKKLLLKLIRYDQFVSGECKLGMTPLFLNSWFPNGGSEHLSSSWPRTWGPQKGNRPRRFSSQRLLNLSAVEPGPIKNEILMKNKNEPIKLFFEQSTPQGQHLVSRQMTQSFLENVGPDSIPPA
jgi:hypothetical protein